MDTVARYPKINYQCKKQIKSNYPIQLDKD